MLNRTLFGVILAGLLAGCGGGSDINYGNSPHTSFSYDCEVTSPNGTCILNRDQTIPTPQSIGLDIDEAWIQVQECMGFTGTQPPAVEYLPSTWFLNGVFGVIFLDQGYYASVFSFDIANKAHRYLEQTMHEFVHLNLELNGFSRDKNDNHEYDWFDRCVTFKHTLI